MPHLTPEQKNDFKENGCLIIRNALTPEQVNEDKMAFANKLLEEAEHDMQRMGLELDTLKIQNVTDDARQAKFLVRGLVVMSEPFHSSAPIPTTGRMFLAGSKPART